MAVFSHWIHYLPITYPHTYIYTILAIICCFSFCSFYFNIFCNLHSHTQRKICLPSLKKQTFEDFELIIVDNGSTDGSQDFIRKNYPEIHLLKLEKNIGFSPAVNLGIKAGIGEYFVLINNDTKVNVIDLVRVGFEYNTR